MWICGGFEGGGRDEVTINVPDVYMARDVMILMRENPFRGPMEGVGPENQDFFGALKWQPAK